MTPAPARAIGCLRLLAALLAGVLSAPASAAAPLTAREQNLEDAADALRLGIPAAALVLTYVLPPRLPADAADAPGGLLRMGGTPRHDLVLALGRTALVTEALKRSIDARRPNGDSRSFPSGHTSVSFAGAEFIRHQYGWRWGAPAYAAAAFVGWSRVETHHHYWRDVIAGAALGVLANHDLHEFRRGSARLRFAVAPVVAGRQVAPGIGFTWRTGEDGT